MVMMKYTDDCGGDGGGGDDEEKGWRSLLARPPIGGTTTNAAPLPASHATTIKLVKYCLNSKLFIHSSFGAIILPKLVYDGKPQVPFLYSNFAAELLDDT